MLVLEEHIAFGEVEVENEESTHLVWGHSIDVEQDRLFALWILVLHQRNEIQVLALDDISEVQAVVAIHEGVLLLRGTDRKIHRKSRLAQLSLQVFVHEFYIFLSLRIVLLTDFGELKNFKKLPRMWLSMIYP